MFRFAILVLAGIGLGALLFGGAPSASAGIGFLALIPLFFLFKILFIALLFSVFARRGFAKGMRSRPFGTDWTQSRGPWRRSRSKSETDRPKETDRFDEWHRMAHAKDEVASWADEPE